MSNLMSDVEAPCAVEFGCDAIQMVLKPSKKDLGGFTATRLLPVKECRSVGPWVFFDHMGPASFAPGHGVDVRPHPHIGLATVTYLFDGEMLHRDSLGTAQVIRPGEVNLMIAGRGVVHSERQREAVKAKPHSVHGLQLWLALPEEHEQTDPAFHHYDRQEIPEIVHSDVSVRILIGTAYGVTSPVKTLSETLYIEATLKDGQSFDIPSASERAIYVVEGAIDIGERHLQAQEMVVLDSAPGVIVKARENCRIAIIGGDSLGPRYIEWNFVASNRQLIHQAKADWASGLFETIPDDHEEFIPLPSK
ncbi:MAG TPA: pirin family protein [Marinagarivorans sp.]